MCLKRIPKSLYTCAFDFSCLTLSTAFCIATLVLIVTRFLVHVLVISVDMIVMRSQLSMRLRVKQLSRPLDSVRHNERDKSA